MYSKLKIGDKVEVIDKLEEEMWIHTTGIVTATTLSTISVTFPTFTIGNYTGRLYRNHITKSYFKKNGKCKWRDSFLGKIIRGKRNDKI